MAEVKRTKRTLEQMIEYWQEKIKKAEIEVDKANKVLEDCRERLRKVQKRIEIKEKVAELKVEFEMRVKELKG